MEISPYLGFNGQCEEAFRFYEKVLGGKLGEMFTYGNSPMKDQIPPGHHDRVMHVTLAVGDAVLMGSDAPSTETSTPHGISVSIAKLPVEDGARVFKALSEGGTVTMPFAKTFWSAGFGMLVDRYGIPWMVNCD